MWDDGRLTLKEQISLFIATLVFVGFLLFALYYVDDTSYCKKHESANPDISFSWEWSTGCMFELPDGTWANLREYEDRNQYKLEILE